MSSISSVASTSSVLRPAALFCADCVPSAVTMDPHKQDTLQFSWTLCVIHLADLHAAPLNPYQQDLQPPPTQSSPTHPITFPTANRAINTGAGPALTLDQATPQSQPAPLSVPLASPVLAHCCVAVFNRPVREDSSYSHGSPGSPHHQGSIGQARRLPPDQRPTVALPTSYRHPTVALPTSYNRRPTGARPTCLIHSMTLISIKRFCDYLYQ